MNVLILLYIALGKVVYYEKHVSLNFNLNKIEKTFLFSLLVSVGMLIAVGNIYWICGKFGIRLAPGWYQDIVDFVSAGGSIVDAFAIIAGITLPAWIAPVLAGFGVVSA